MNRFWRLLCLLVPLALAACAETPIAPTETRPVTPGNASVTPPASTANTNKSRPPVVTKRGGAFYKDDGPGDNPPPDMDTIPDATPRAEPLLAAANRPYNALGQEYVPMQQIQPYTKQGIASWYGRRFHGKRTSSGEPYDMYGMTGAHPTLPIPSYVRVTNLANNKSVIVRINDRGPFHSSRIIDLSYTAAWKLGYADRGSAEVRVEAIVPDEMDMVAANASKKSGSKPVLSSASAATTPPLTAAATPPAPVMTADTPSASPAPVGGIYLQLGAFASKANADSFRDYVLGELKWLTQDISSRFGGDKYRLHVGPFQSTEEARSVADRIAQSIKLRPFVVTL